MVMSKQMHASAESMLVWSHVLTSLPFDFKDLVVPDGNVFPHSAVGRFEHGRQVACVHGLRPGSCLAGGLQGQVDRHAIG